MTTELVAGLPSRSAGELLRRHGGLVRWRFRRGGAAKRSAGFRAEAWSRVAAMAMFPLKPKLPASFHRSLAAVGVCVAGVNGTFSSLVNLSFRFPPSPHGACGFVLGSGVVRSCN
jgi:hypothetical protein